MYSFGQVLLAEETHVGLAQVAAPSAVDLASLLGFVNVRKAAKKSRKI